MTNSPPPLVTITLDARGVGVAAQLAAKEVYDIFALAYPAIQRADLSSVPPLADESVHHQMEMLGRSPEDGVASTNRRLMAMCISDLARSVRQSLEDAATHLDIVSHLFPAAIRSGIEDGSEDDMVADIQAAVMVERETFRQKAQAMRHPQLVDKVARGLRAPLSWTPELSSFQKLRNCLEHRGGIVGRNDIDDTGSMVLRLPYLKVDVIGRSGATRPFQIGMALSEPSRMEVEIAVRTTIFDLGQTVDFEPRRIGELAFACWVFASDIVDKLTPTGSPSNQIKIHI